MRCPTLELSQHLSSLSRTSNLYPSRPCLMPLTPHYNHIHLAVVQCTVKQLIMSPNNQTCCIDCSDQALWDAETDQRLLTAASNLMYPVVIVAGIPPPWDATTGTVRLPCHLHVALTRHSTRTGASSFSISI